MLEAVGGFHGRADGSERAHHHTSLKAAAVAMSGRKRQTVGCLIAGAHVNNILFFLIDESCFCYFCVSGQFLQMKAAGASLRQRGGECFQSEGG